VFGVTGLEVVIRGSGGQFGHGSVWSMIGIKHAGHIVSCGNFIEK